MDAAGTNHHPTSGLAGALAAVQAKIPSIHKDRTAVIEKKAGGRYKYQYVDLAAVTAVVLPLLGAHGLCWITKPTMRDGRFVLEYKLAHESGEQEIGEYPLPSGGSQTEIGSAITYARRYCLCCVTGIAPDDDDAAVATRTSREPTPRASAEQQHGLRRSFAQLDRVDVAEQNGWLSWLTGRTIGDIADLNADEAQEGLRRLSDRIAEQQQQQP